MPIDGSGNFTRSYNFTNDKNSGIKIVSSRMDGEFDNFAAAMNQMFLRSGQAGMTGNLNMGSNTITSLGSGVSNTPALRFNADASSGLYLPAYGQVAMAAGGIQRVTATSAGAEVNGAFSTSGSATFSSTVNATGAAVFSSTLTVAGAAALNGGLTVTGLTSTTTLNSSGAATFGSTLGVTGATSLNGGLTVTGNASVSGNAAFNTLSATNLATFNGGIQTNGSVNITSGLVAGSATIGGGASGSMYMAGNQFEMGNGRTAAGDIYTDMHASVGSDYDARIIRYSGVNGGFDIVNAGTGEMKVGTLGAGALTFMTGSAGRMVVTNGGLVGVGTSAPATQFHNTGESTLSGAIHHGPDDNLIYQPASNNLTFRVGTGANQVYAAIKGSTNGPLLDGPSGTLALSASGVEGLRVLSTGRVGIGTQSPGSRLHVQGALGGINFADNGDQMSFGYNGANYLTATGANAMLQMGATGASGYLNFVAGNADRMRITSGGLVGVGTNSPSSNVHVASNNATVNQGFLTEYTGSSLNASARLGMKTNVSTSNHQQVWIGNQVMDAGNTYGAFVVAQYNNVGNYVQTLMAYLMQNDAWQFFTAGSERVRIDNQGRVGIGTVGPQHALQVVGSIAAGNGTYVAFTGSGIGNGTPFMYGDTVSLAMNAPVSGYMAFKGNNTEFARFDSSGRLGINLTNPLEKLHVQGNGRWVNDAGVGETSLRLDNNTVGGRSYLLGTGGSGGAFSGGAFGLWDATAGTIRWVVGSDGKTAFNGGLAGARLAVYSSTAGNVFEYTDDGAIELTRSGGSAYVDFKATQGNDFDCRIMSSGSGGTSELAFYAGAGVSDKMRIRSDGSVYVSNNTIELGYRDTIQNAQAGAYTLAFSDRGKHILLTGGANNVTIPPNSSVAFTFGTTIALINDGTAARTIAQGAGVTLKWAGSGTTGNRTLGIGGMATLLKVGTDTWYVSGAGVS